MKRDLDLIRKILIKIEDGQEFLQTLQLEDFKFDGYSDDLVKYNLKRMNEARYLDGFFEQTAYGDLVVSIQGLTSIGHDFLDAARDDARWIKAKSILSELKNFSLDLARIVLTDLASAAAKAAIQG
ncbi:MAG: DUF2513 domain-containing protein [Bellilinea sp.]